MINPSEHEPVHPEEPLDIEQGKTAPQIQAEPLGEQAPTAAPVAPVAPPPAEQVVSPAPVVTDPQKKVVPLSIESVENEPIYGGVAGADDLSKELEAGNES